MVTLTVVVLGFDYYTSTAQGGGRGGGRDGEDHVGMYMYIQTCT